MGLIPLAVFLCASVAMAASAKSKAVFDPQPGWQICKVDADCVQVDNDCAGCCRSSTVNAKFSIDFKKAKQKFCKGFVGGICDCIEPRVKITCVKSKCVLEKLPEAPPPE